MKIFLTRGSIYTVNDVGLTCLELFYGEALRHIRIDELPAQSRHSIFLAMRSRN